MSVFPTVISETRKLDSLAVSTVGCVNRDLVSLVDEERNHDLSSSLEGDFLKSGSSSGIMWLLCCVYQLKNDNMFMVVVSAIISVLFFALALLKKIKRKGSLLGLWIC